MTLLWALLGAVIGVATAPPHGGLIGVLAFIIAGVIVMPPLGVVLGLIGGEVRPTLGGALVGAGVGALVGMLAAPGSTAFVASVGLIGGGMVGATSFALLSWAFFLRNLALSGRR